MVVQLTVKRSALPFIIPAVRTQLVTADVIDDTSIFECPSVDIRQLPELIAPHDVFLAVGMERPDGRFDDGSARFDRRVRRVLNVLCRTRMNLDKINDWQAWLTDDINGHLVFEDAVFNALDDAYLYDAAGNQLVYESLFCAGIREPTQTDRPGWGGSVMVFELPYRRDMPQPGPVGNG